MSRRRSRDVEIFNFSFLDILACTIGLLIFIMVMVFVLQSGSAVADTSGIIAHRAQQTRNAQQAAARNDQISSMLEKQLAAIPSRVSPAILQARQDAQAAVDQAQATLDQVNASLRQAEAALADARAGQSAAHQTEAQAQAELALARQHYADAQSGLAAAKAAAVPHLVAVSAHDQQNTTDPSFQILHVDCQANEVVLLLPSANGRLREVGRTSLDSLDDPDSAFTKAVARQKDESNPLVLFWVRPDGVKTFEAASHALPDDVPHGFEPADADWKFTGDSGQ